ncbi:hypothetical protein KIL84_013449 [Mauremys mutica]|uniref:ribonuclease H n=1 Tax=Mauremys mutica TaxID=74926 RepID=A0A9D3WVH6_9SAUR|nr:hypothetical protein KIL84_013449 [Mauremys mutica]
MEEVKNNTIDEERQSRRLSNYRPITLLSQVYKVFTHVILSRIKKDLEMHESREQAGFWAGSSSKKCKEYKVPLCLAFVDYKIGINLKYIDLLEEINCNCSTEITLFNIPGIIIIHRGVRQGDTISPKLFAAVLESLLKKLNWEEGIRIDREQLMHILIADNCIILAKDTAELENKLQQLQTLSHDIGLEVNTLKMKWMRNEH